MPNKLEIFMYSRYNKEFEKRKNLGQICIMSALKKGIINAEQAANMIEMWFDECTKICRNNPLRSFDNIVLQQYEPLINLIGEKNLNNQLGRLSKIYNVCEAAWLRNLDRIKSVEVKYLLIAESPPWSPVDPVNYFYETFDRTSDGVTISWIRGVWKALCDDETIGNTDQCLDSLARRQFLLIDTLPFGIDLNYRQRSSKAYGQLVDFCSLYFFEKLTDQRIKWAKDCRIAFAFKKNALAFISAFPGGFELPNGIKFDYTENNIAATGSGFPTCRSLKSAWRL